jgi:hypothetical protein
VSVRPSRTGRTPRDTVPQGSRGGKDQGAARGACGGLPIPGSTSHPAGDMKQGPPCHPCFLPVSHTPPAVCLVGEGSS